MNLLGLTGLAVGTILTRYIVSGQKANQAIQNQNNANLQNELLLFATGNSRALSAYQKLTNTNIGNLTKGLGNLSLQLKSSQETLSNLGTEIGTVQNNTATDIKTINSQLQNLSAQINTVSNNVNQSSSNDGIFGFLGF
jgi:uncharacterized membrane-anchored protein YhcB (DUF1043 family)